MSAWSNSGCDGAAAREVAPPVSSVGNGSVVAWPDALLVDAGVPADRSSCGAQPIAASRMATIRTRGIGPDSEAPNRDDPILRYGIRRTGPERAVHDEQPATTSCP